MGLRRRKQQIHKDRIYLGRIIKPHALQGEVKFNPFGCDPWILEKLTQVYIETPDLNLNVEYVRGAEKSPIVKFKEINTRSQSEEIAGALVWVREHTLPELADDEVYESDLLFARAVSLNGDEIGEIHDIIETGECDVLVVKTVDGRELLLPANRETVREIRKDENTVLINPPEMDD